MAAPSIVDISKKVSDKYGTPKKDAAAAAASVPQEDDKDQTIAKALIGLAPIALGAAIGGETGGAIGAQAGQKGLTMMAEQEQSERENAIAKAAAEAAAKEKAFDHQIKLRQLALQEQEAAAKRQEQQLGGKPTADQSKAAMFARRTRQAEDDMARLESTGYSRASKWEAAKGMLPGVMKPEAALLQEQAERNFVNAILRRESGAAISQSEFASAEAQYFPRAGDTPEVIEQKRRNRQLAIAGLEGEAGPRALAAIPVIQAPPMAAGGGSMSLPSGVPSAYAADDKVMKYAKDHGLSVEQASRILSKRGYNGQ